MHRPVQETRAGIARRERYLQTIALRRDQTLSLQDIADRVGVSSEQVRRDINKHMAKLDAECLAGVASLRAELFEKYDAVLQKLEREVLTDGNLDRVPDLLKAAAEIRKLYAVDVQPLGRNELSLRRAVITEIATKLRDQLPPETFAEVAFLLTEDEPIQLLDGVATSPADAEGASPARRQHQGQSNPRGSRAKAAEVADAGEHSRTAPAVVDVDHLS